MTTSPLEIYYWNRRGVFLWREPMIFKRLFTRDDVVGEGGRSYIVDRVIVSDLIQHVSFR